MNLEFWKFLSGMVIVEGTSAAPEKMLEDILLSGIALLHVEQKDELTYRFLIHRRNYNVLSKMFQRQGNSLRIVRRKGLYWSIKAFWHRPVLMASILFLLSVSVFLPSRIFFVRVDGNTNMPDRLILSAAEDCGIRFGVSRKQVRSESLKNALLTAVPQLQWAGVNTSGCVATITVRERIPVEESSEQRIVSNLIAERDGYILSTTVTSGTSYVKPGETVSKGQLLISGLTDCGICIRASRAEGEILAQTIRKVSAVMPATYDSPEFNSEIRYKISLLVGKKRINLWKDSRISDTGCGRMYEEYFVSFPGGFQLPIGIGVDRYCGYTVRKTAVSETDAQLQLKDFSESYLNRQMIAGQIIRTQQHISSSDGLYKMDSSYVCTEMIGQEQREQIGEIHEQRN